MAAHLGSEDAWEAQARAEFQGAAAALHDGRVGGKVVGQELGGGPHNLAREIVVRCMHVTVVGRCEADKQTGPGWLNGGVRAALEADGEQSRRSVCSPALNSRSS